MVLKAIKALEIINGAYHDGLISLSQKNHLITVFQKGLNEKNIGLEQSLAIHELPAGIREKLQSLVLE